ncbi:MAG: hypothetical protein LBT50_08440 [Prevotellaceae bacterium]|jgi:hypothetical protein|nr:hypothetical protein [Prevotellaceae bacterium]
MRFGYLLLAILVLFSCQGNETPEAITKKWTGKTIKFSDEKPVHLYAKDTARYGDDVKKPYKILLYIDSTGCTSCKLRMNIWKKLITEIGDKSDFLFWFHRVLPY